jgi:hypothetical protein
VIKDVVEKWHDHLRGELDGGLDALLDDDVVFYSPIVFTPQVGKAITTLYLTAAAQTFPGDSATGSTGGSAPAERSFHYTKEVLAGNVAILEFETQIKGTYVNGVDIITVNSDDRIIEFRVMIRPLRAVNLIHEQMGAMLERLESQNPS